MAGAKPPAGAPPQKSPTKVVIWMVVITVVVVATCIGVSLNRDSTTVVPPPTASQRAEAVAVLKRNAEAQGVCYGWQLKDGIQLISVGSNLGDGIPASDPERCPRWVEVVASVNWTSESSELDDWASVWMAASEDVDRPTITAMQRDLERFGPNNKLFVDDPGWAVTRAAVTLPLLTAERGVVAPAPVATGAPTGLSPLPTAGNDLWRDRRVYLLAAAGLLLLTGLLVTVGLVQRRRQLHSAVRAAAEEVATPARSQSVTRTRKRS